MATKNIQLKDGQGNLLMPNVAQDNDSLAEKFSISDNSGNVGMTIDENIELGKRGVVPRSLQSLGDYAIKDADGNTILLIEDGKIKTSAFDSNFAGGKRRMILPKVINSYVGDVLQIFKYPATILPDYDSWGVNFSVNSSDNSVKALGRTLRRYFEFTPNATGTYEILVNLVDDRRMLHFQDTMTINVITPTSPSTMKNVLFIGDSETMGEMNNSPITAAMGASVEKNATFPFANEVKRLLTGNDSAQDGMPASIGLTNIQLIGTQNTSGGRHEGYGGRDAAWFMSSYSPFYKSGKIDFNAYLAQNSVYTDTSHKGVDYIYILLGANNTLDNFKINDRVCASKSNYTTQMLTLLNVIKAQLIDDPSKTYYNPNLKIILLNYAFPTIDGRGYHPYGSNEFGDNIGAMMGYLNVYQQNTMLANRSEYSGILSNVLISPQVDSENSYAYWMKNKNNYSTEKELNHIEAVHPNEEGYKMFGAAVVRDLIGRL